MFAAKVSSQFVVENGDRVMNFKIAEAALEDPLKTVDG
jgi:hypothetical protein